MDTKSRRYLCGFRLCETAKLRGQFLFPGRRVCRRCPNSDEGILYLSPLSCLFFGQIEGEIKLGPDSSPVFLLFLAFPQFGSKAFSRRLLQSYLCCKFCGRDGPQSEIKGSSILIPLPLTHVSAGLAQGCKQTIIRKFILEPSIEALN